MSEEKIVSPMSGQRKEYHPEEIKTVVEVLDQNALMHLIPDELPSYTGSKMLTLSKLGIMSLGQLSCLDHLNRLDLSYNKLKSVRSLEALQELTYLNLNGNILSGKGIRGLFALEQVVFLNLGNNRIGIIPDFAFAKMTHLKCLLLNNNKLENISFVSILTELNTLVLSNNRISSIPEDTFKALVSLRKLSLGHNQLRAFPPVFHITSLKELNLNSNKISSIPDSITALVHLTQLDIGNNLIENVESLAILRSLPHLTKLNVAQNTFYGESRREEDLEMVSQRVRDLLPQLTVLNNRQLALGKERKELRKRHFEEKHSTKKEVLAKKPNKDTQATSVQKNKESGKSIKKGEKSPKVKDSREKSDDIPKIPSHRMTVGKNVSVQEESEESVDSTDAVDPTEFVETTEPVDLTQTSVVSIETSKESHKSTIEDVRSFLMKEKNNELELDGWD